jgi:hypothetical protein
MIKEAMGQIIDKKYHEKYVYNKISLLAIAVGDKKEIGCEFQTLQSLAYHKHSPINNIYTQKN